MTRGAFLRLLMAQAARRKPAQDMRKSSPLEIRLVVTGGPALRASLVNVFAGPLMVMHNRNLQPSQPVLATLAGQKVRIDDRRQSEKYDRTPYRDLYHKLESGQVLMLWEEKFAWADDGYSYYFRWGPFEALGIPPGSYTASIRWKSALTDWVDSETRQTGRWKDIWLGELTSNQVQLELPKRP